MINDDDVEHCISKGRQGQLTTLTRKAIAVTISIVI